MNNAIMFQYEGNGDSTDEEQSSPEEKPASAPKSEKNGEMDVKLNKLMRAKGYTLDEEEHQLTANPRKSILAKSGLSRDNAGGPSRATLQEAEPRQSRLDATDASKLASTV